MITYYIHPKAEDGGCQKVSRLRHFHGNPNLRYLTHEAWIDFPTFYDDEKYNLHYDGCNYLKDSYMECIEKFLELDAFTLDKGLDYRRDKVQLIFTHQPYAEDRLQDKWYDWQHPYKAYKNFNF